MLVLVFYTLAANISITEPLLNRSAQHDQPFKDIMNNSRLFHTSLLAATVSSAALISVQANAAGFQLNAQSATGLGRAFAGDAVIADNASSMSRNAASLSLFDRTEITLGTNIINSEIDVKDVEYYSPLSGGPVPIADAQNTGTSVVPNIFIAHPINDQFSIGFGAYSNYGTSNEFDDKWGAGTSQLPLPGADAFGGTTNVTSMNMLVAGSYRINDQWTLGAGIDFIYGEGELKRQSEMNNWIGDGTTTVNLLDVDASAWGVGFNLGAVYEIDENNRLGLSYHHSPEIEASGTVSYMGNGSVGDLIMPLPSRAEFSGYHRIEDTKFAVHYSVQYISWSDFDALVTTDGTNVKDYQWKDTFHYSIGATYYINKHWEARVGYMYDEGVQNDLTSVSVPDSDRQWFSAGASYHFNQDQSLDFGITYLVGKEVSVEDEINGGVSNGGLTLNATTEASAVLFGGQYTHRF
ncbi:Long-chain fatty acid transport protein [Sinobacterium norvegicum]|uniref:Long-chain fatty acid transport protein n=1 Tax=Sinobacterium norvegicum TaxID=1641715 RepID=A0ABN8EFB4_9GAMM|nr:outer membrane protein transport protein [Sinobacterium norvegicum]CAH0991083.1 Long-chain fatty acid transport protein [Sinobacterium norvegicum]